MMLQSYIQELHENIKRCESSEVAFGARSMSCDPKPPSLDSSRRMFNATFGKENLQTSKIVNIETQDSELTDESCLSDNTNTNKLEGKP